MSFFDFFKLLATSHMIIIVANISLSLLMSLLGHQKEADKVKWGRSERAEHRGAEYTSFANDRKIVDNVATRNTRVTKPTRPFAVWYVAPATTITKLNPAVAFIISL